MRRTHVAFLVFTAFFSAPFLVQAAIPPASSPSVEYAVTIPDLSAEIFHVTAAVHNLPLDTMTFNFPIWAPGAYDLVYFGRYVHDFVATDAKGNSLQVIRADSNTVKIVHAPAEMNIAYDVHDIENVSNSLWFGLSDIEKGYVFATGTSLFGYPAGYKNIPYSVSYTPPAGMDVAVALDPIPGKTNVYSAADYDILVDAPMQMGTFQRLNFTVQGKPHVITVTAPETLDTSDARKLVEHTKRIVEMETKFFGNMPYNRYLFELYLVKPNPGESIFGALEHANSSTYRMPYQRGRIADELDGTIAHEFWHLWSPKRIHVAELGPFDYQRAPHTSSLWFAEGLTEYYAHQLLRREGLESSDQTLASIEELAGALYGKPQKMSLAELSLGISTLNPSQIFPLYSKGPFVGLLLDADIRSQTGNKKSLDDAFRFFNENYGKTGKTFRDEDIIPAIESITGAKLQDFFKRYIQGREALPIAEFFPKMGLKLDSEIVMTPLLGATVEKAEAGWAVTEVVPHGSADSMGLRVGDTLTGLDLGPQTIPLSQIDPVFAKYISQFKAGIQLPGPGGVPITVTKTTFNYTRSGKKYSADIRLVDMPVTVWHVNADSNADALAASIRKSLVGL